MREKYNRPIKSDDADSAVLSLGVKITQSLLTYDHKPVLTNKGLNKKYKKKCSKEMFSAFYSNSFINLSNT